MIVRSTLLKYEEYSKSIVFAASELYKRSTYTASEYSNLCEIHKIFQREEGETSHSCVACNLADISDYLLRSLNNLGVITNQFDAFVSFCLPAYLLVERFEEVFRIIKLPDYYEQRHFQNLKLIRRWANFLKHPKAFLFVHHPQYYFEDEVSVDASEKKYTVIDSDFVKEHYTGDAKNTKLYSTLTNKDQVIVLFPSLLQLTEGLIDAQNHFIDIITNNKVFREVLTEKSVLVNYFQKLDEEEQNEEGKA